MSSFLPYVSVHVGTHYVGKIISSFSILIVTFCISSRYGEPDRHICRSATKTKVPSAIWETVFRRRITKKRNGHRRTISTASLQGQTHGEQNGECDFYYNFYVYIYILNNTLFVFPSALCALCVSNLPDNFHIVRQRLRLEVSLRQKTLKLSRVHYQWKEPLLCFFCCSIHYQ